MDRRLVRVVGKKDVPGKPFLFGTTREFMEVFGLGSLGDLPSMREIEEYLSSSAATPVESARPGLELPFPEAEGGGAEGSEAGPFGVAEEPLFGDPGNIAVGEAGAPGNAAGEEARSAEEGGSAEGAADAEGAVDAEEPGAARTGPAAGEEEPPDPDAF